jgi:hypothetical protein
MDDGPIQLEITGILTPSAEPGGLVKIGLSSPIGGDEQIRITGERIGRLQTSWAFSTEGQRGSDDDEASVNLVVPDMEPGLYRVATVIVGSSIEVATRPGASLLFEVQSAEGRSRTASELIAERDRILKERASCLETGIGDGAQDFAIVVFSKECMITTPLNLGPYLAIPREGLGSEDELTAVKSYLAEHGVSNFDPGDTWRQVSQAGEPCTVVAFETVKADGQDEAVSQGLREADLLLALLSLHRGGYGSIFAAVIVEKASGRMGLWQNRPIYTGNLLGGFTSGEDSEVLAQQMGRLRASQPAQLYMALLREAMREKDSEFKCFRFWNVLETAARSYNYPGQPMHDWHGNTVPNRRSQARLVQDKAEDIVLEHLRRVLTSRGHNNESFATNLQQGKIDEQILIWYRRRNCVAHGGECLCRNPNLQLSKPKFTNCKNARDEVVAIGDDLYLRTLQAVAVMVVMAELR